MQKTIFLISFCFLVLFTNGQVDHGYCRIKKTKINTEKISDSCKVIFHFFSPSKEPAKSHIKFSVNNDTVIPRISSKGTYSKSFLPGKHKFTFCGTSWYDIKTKEILLKKDSTTIIKVYFAAKEMKMPQVTYDLGKPVLYFYPTEPTEVKVNLIFTGKIFFSYPKYNSGWSFKAYPDGKLEINENKYNYLFWEGEKGVETLNTNWNEGFIIDSDSLVEFFEKKLKTLQLNSQEIEDFITFWVPKMQIHSKNTIHFLFNEEYDQLASLQIIPPPDNLIRFFMVWAPFQNNMNLIPQKFPIYKRNGFTVVDWGGTEIKKLPTLPQ